MTTREFAEKLVEENQALIDKMQDCKCPEEAYAAAKGEGLTDSFEEFSAVMTGIYKSIEDLSDEDLENVAGGTTVENVYCAVTISVTAAATVVTAASTAAMA